MEWMEMLCKQMKSCSTDLRSGNWFVLLQDVLAHCPSALCSTILLVLHLAEYEQKVHPLPVSSDIITADTCMTCWGSWTWDHDIWKQCCISVSWPQVPLDHWTLHDIMRNNILRTLYMTVVHFQTANPFPQQLAPLYTLCSAEERPNRFENVWQH